MIPSSFEQSSQSSESYVALVQSLTEAQLQQIAEAIASGHSIDLYQACTHQLQSGTTLSSELPSKLSPEDYQGQMQMLQADLQVERSRRQAAEQDAFLWKQKFAKTVNYLRRHL